MKSKLTSKTPPADGIVEVVSPREVTASATSHHSLRNGESANFTFPTTCIHMCRVSRVSRHSESGRVGQIWGLSLTVLSVCMLHVLSNHHDSVRSRTSTEWQKSDRSRWHTICRHENIRVSTFLYSRQVIEGADYGRRNGRDTSSDGKQGYGQTDRTAS